MIYLAAWFEVVMNEQVIGFMGPRHFYCVRIRGSALALQPDIGTLIIVLVLSRSGCTCGWRQFKTFGAILGIGMVLLMGLIYFKPYRFNRVLSFVNQSADTRGDFISYKSG